MYVYTYTHTRMRVIDVIRAFPDKPWDYDRLTLDKDITFADICI